MSEAICTSVERCKGPVMQKWNTPFFFLLDWAPIMLIGTAVNLVSGPE